MISFVKERRDKQLSKLRKLTVKGFIWLLVQNDFYPLNGNRGLMMTLEGSVKEYLSHIQNRKPAASQIFMSTQFLKRKMTKNILSN